MPSVAYLVHSVLQENKSDKEESRKAFRILRLGVILLVFYILVMGSKIEAKA